MKKATSLYAAGGALALVALFAWAFAPRPVDVEAATAAQGHFVHVYVDRVTRRPVNLPAALRAALEPIGVAIGTAD